MKILIVLAILLFAMSGRAFSALFPTPRAGGQSSNDERDE